MAGTAASPAVKNSETIRTTSGMSSEWAIVEVIAVIIAEFADAKCGEK